MTKAVWGRNAATGNCNGVDRFVEACKCDAVHTTIIVGHTVTSIDKTDTLCHRHTPAVASVLSADKAMSKAFLTFKKSAGHYEPGMQDNVSRDLMYWKLTNTGAVPVHLRSEPRRPESPSIGMLLGVICSYSCLCPCSYVRTRALSLTLTPTLPCTRIPNLSLTLVLLLSSDSYSYYEASSCSCA